MTRIRTLKPEFWHDEKLAPMSPIDRLVFLGLISMSDDFGRVHDNVKVIDAFIFPETSESVRESLANLSRIGRVRRGKSSSGMQILEIVNWAKHQRVDKPQPHKALPEICSKTLENTGETSIPESFANSSGIVPESFRPLTSDLLPPTTDQGKGEGAKNQKAKPPPPAWIIPVEFDTPEIQELLAKFTAMRIRIKKPIKDFGNSSLILKRFDSIDHLAYALETCIANEYQGLKPDYRPSNNGKPKEIAW